MYTADGTEHRGLRTAQPVVWSTTSSTQCIRRYGIASTLLDALPGTSERPSQMVSRDGADEDSEVPHPEWHPDAMLWMRYPDVVLHRYMLCSVEQPEVSYGELMLPYSVDEQGSIMGSVDPVPLVRYYHELSASCHT